MAYQILARKYRPQRFSDVAGQEHVTRTLLNALEQGRIAHGYIFSGHRGIGKTTIARILGMALNCRNAIGRAERPSAEPCGLCVSCQEIRAGNSVDMLEIDAATNRGIDEIRELRDAARYSPARDRYKICLLDEAHQITDAAFNALLKTLEEPPEHVVFMMATTQPEDIPQTIRSRCQHFSFHAVKFDDILTELGRIAEAENILAEDGALALLAEAGDGSMRDALSIMDQASASAPLVDGKAKLESQQIRELMGSVPNTVFERLLEDIHKNQSAAVMEQINRLLNAGNSPSQLARQFVRYLRNCLMAKLGGETTELLEISADERARSARSAALFSEEDLTRFLQVMLRTFDELNYRQEQRFHLELGLLKLVHLERLIPLEEILSSLSGGRSGTAARPAPSSLPNRQSSDSRSSAQGGPTPAGGDGSGGASRSSQSSLPAALTEGAAPAKGQLAFGAEALPDPPAEPQAQPETDAIDIDAVRDAVVAALGTQGHDTAAVLLSAGSWRLGAEGSIQAEVSTTKTMLGLALNAEAWKIIRAALRDAGAPQKMTVTSGQSGQPEANGSAPGRVPTPAGSIQAVALENPLVQQAQQLFHAEVRSVVDLREISQENSRNKR